MPASRHRAADAARELADERKRFGYRRLFVLLRQQGEPSGINRIYRSIGRRAYRAQTAARRRAVGDAGADLVGVRLNARGSLDLSMTSSPAVADCQSAFNFLTRIGVQLLDAKIALRGSLLQAIYTPNSDVGAFVHLPTLLGSKV